MRNNQKISFWRGHHARRAQHQALVVNTDDHCLVQRGSRTQRHSQGAAHALGFRSMAKDLDFNFDLVVHSDAVAAIGIARRRGIGRVRHLSTTDLWVQEKIRNGDIQLLKIDGKENPADLFTKYLPRPLLDKHLLRLGVQKEEGRADAAPQLVVANGSLR